MTIQKIYIFTRINKEGSVSKIEPYGNLKKLCEKEKCDASYNLISREIREAGMYTDGKTTVYKRVLKKTKVSKKKTAKAA